MKNDITGSEEVTVRVVAGVSKMLMNQHSSVVTVGE